MTTWLHASMRSNLDLVGIKCFSAPLVSYKKSPYVFLGTLDYLVKQYFKYAPKGEYYLYEVDVEGLSVDTSPVGNQVKIAGDINASRVVRHSKHRI